jgi:hypothetical protein
LASRFITMISLIKRRLQPCLPKIVGRLTQSILLRLNPAIALLQTMKVPRPSLHSVIAGALLAMSVTAFAETPRVLADQEFFSKGKFIAYAAPWSTYDGPGAALKHGVDFRDEIAVHPESFPADSEFSWHWPLTPAKGQGVYGYNALSYGSYDGGVPETPVPPREVKEIKTLGETFRFEIARPIGDFNVLTEFFLTEKRDGEKVAEIGFFLHTSESAVAFANDGEQLGSFTDATGRAWKVAIQTAPAGPYFMFIPEGDVLTGSIDFKAALDFLRGKNKLKGSEWFSGLAFGIEPITGSGSMRVKALAVDYQ